MLVISLMPAADSIKVGATAKMSVLTLGGQRECMPSVTWGSHLCSYSLCSESKSCAGNGGRKVKAFGNLTPNFLINDFH